LWSQDPHFTAPVALLARLRLPAGLHAASSSSRIDRQRRPRMYNLAAFLPRRRLEMRPTPPPYPRTVSPAGPQAAPARSFLVENQQAGHTTGSPSPPALCRAMALRSCTTQRASRRSSDGSLGILRFGALSGSPWPLAHDML